jgi:predicted acylesterase/phospholipase RssA
MQQQSQEPTPAEQGERGGPKAARRLALSVQGAVALGAYQAGVLTQLYADVWAYNEKAAEDEKIVIDALAGASAGAVTALILAKALAYGYPPEELEAAMRKVWVEGLDIKNLLADLESKDNAMFDGKTIDELAGELFPEEEAPKEGGATHWIGLWITLTNLSGVPYCLKVANATVYAKMHRDYMPFLIKGKDIYDVTFPIEKIGPASPESVLRKVRPIDWKVAVEAAIASAAFPVAFRSRPVNRSFKGYPDYRLMRRSAAKEGIELPKEAHIHYADGGVLNNQPVGRAIDAATFVNKLEGTKPESRFEDTERTYLIIEPNPTSLQDMEKWARGLEEREAHHKHGLPLPPLLGGVVESYFNESLWADLANADSINKKLRAIRKEYKKLEELPDGDEKTTGVSVFNQVLKCAKLDYKRIVDIQRIPGDELEGRELAGAGRGHFDGFLGEELRKHDFDLGRYEARAWFRNWIDNVPSLRADRPEFPLLPAMPAPPPVPSLPTRLLFARAFWLAENMSFVKKMLMGFLASARKKLLPALVVLFVVVVASLVGTMLLSPPTAFAAAAVFGASLLLLSLLAWLYSVVVRQLRAAQQGKPSNGP